MNLPEVIVSRTDRPQGPAVYALELAQPDAYVVASDRYEDAYDAPAPSWLEGAFDAAACYYVGAAANVSERIREHADGHNRSAAIMKVYDPERVEAIWEMPSPDAAFQAERSKADALQREYPESYVHTR